MFIGPCLTQARILIGACLTQDRICLLVLA